MRLLRKAGAEVRVVLTQDATRFVTPLTFRALSGEKVFTELWDDPDEPIPHTMLARWADAIVVAPATARTLARLAAGLCDDLLSSTILATEKPVLLAPAMHTEMWEHPATQRNAATLAGWGYAQVGPVDGELAGGDTGPGRMAEPDVIVEALAGVLAPGRALAGRTVLVTAGGTREPIDPVRYVGNRSSGRMGHAVAEAAAQRGARVVLVTTSSLPVRGAVKVERVETAQEMYEAVLSRFDEADVVVKAAAVADFRPVRVAPHKVKKDAGVPVVELEPTPDILAALAAARTNQILVGFAAETEHLATNATEKLRRKRLDLLVANDVTAADAGFEVRTNRVTVFGADGSVEEWPVLDKAAVAGRLLDRIEALLEHRPS